MLDADEIKAVVGKRLEGIGGWLIPTGQALPMDLCQRLLTPIPTCPWSMSMGQTECSDAVTHYSDLEAP